MNKPKIVHVMANGQRLNDIKGHIVPADSAVYQVIFEVSKGGNKNVKAC